MCLVRYPVRVTKKSNLHQEKQTLDVLALAGGEW